ncbi:hypothetical protein Pcac1_g1311 [Phytophthora cactorum]|nr:hypothetical protein Pcac1_g1311 [Phytophthora cactorum]
MPAANPTVCWPNSWALLGSRSAALTIDLQQLAVGLRFMRASQPFGLSASGTAG